MLGKIDSKDVCVKSTHKKMLKCNLIYINLFWIEGVIVLSIINHPLAKE